MQAPSAAAEQPSLLFGFRGVRFLQVFLAIAALGIGAGAVVQIATALGEGVPWLLIPGAVTALAFLLLFSMALRLPTSLVAISPDRMRVRFPGFVDYVMPVSNVTGATLTNHGWWQGIGVRTNFGGWVALATAWGESVDLTLKEPLRVWVIPRVLPVRATTLRLTVRNPARMVERFGSPGKAPGNDSNRGKRKR